jgi:hypothetical protein
VADYTLTPYSNVVLRNTDHVMITDAQIYGADWALYPNPDWQAYQSWLAAPNAPDPIPDTPWPVPPMKSTIS